jgi:hypothetical protein
VKQQQLRNQSINHSAEIIPDNCITSFARIGHSKLTGMKVK